MENARAINIELSKEFNVSSERLYQAWTSEHDLRQWWHPMGNTLQRLINDQTPGGKVEYSFENSESKEVFIINGTYKEVEHGKRLVYTWNWQLPTAAIQDSEYLLTILFESTNNGSRLKITQENFANEEAVQPHREGWEKSLSELEAYLNK